MDWADEGEQIILVDEDDNPIGIADKLTSHHSHTPLHRAFSCYIFNSQGKFLVTQRALNKKTWPGIWSNSCCGHVAPGESYEEAARRRVKYELGIELSDLKLLLPDYRYKTELYGVVENEICPVFMATTNLTPAPNPAEVADLVWVDWQEFVKDAIHNPEKYSWWCRDQIRALKAASHPSLPAVQTL